MAKTTSGGKNDPRQRKLGAITPEVVGDLLPAQMQAVPTSVAEFDGWDAKDVSEWLKGLSGSFRRIRAVVGLGLWVLRDRLNGETEYRAYARPIAEAYDVGIDTLTRWRRSVQIELDLPDPAGATGRISAAKQGQAELARKNAATAQAELARKNAADSPRSPDEPAPVGTSEPLVKADSSVEPATEVLPPAVEEPSLEERVADAFQSSLQETVDALLGHKPIEGRLLSSLTFAKLESWVTQAKALRQPTPSSPAPVQRQRMKDEPDNLKDCLHPTSRRIGNQCALCGATVKAAR